MPISRSEIIGFLMAKSTSVLPDFFLSQFSTYLVDFYIQILNKITIACILKDETIGFMYLNNENKNKLERVMTCLLV